MSLIKWVNIKTGRRFWYAVELRFYARTANGRCDATRLMTTFDGIGLAEKSEILNNRSIRKTFEGWAKKASEDIKNGQFKVVVLCYLGWFKKPEKPK